MCTIWRGHCLPCKRGAQNKVRFVGSLSRIAVQSLNSMSKQALLQIFNAIEPSSRLEALVTKIALCTKAFTKAVLMENSIVPIR